MSRANDEPGVPLIPAAVRTTFDSCEITPTRARSRSGGAAAVKFQALRCPPWLRLDRFPLGDAMKMTQPCNVRRRTLLKATAGFGGIGLGGGLLTLDALAQAAGKTTINLQLGWLAGNNQIGEVVAKPTGDHSAEGRGGPV